jgi:hypothetical protein
MLVDMNGRAFEDRIGFNGLGLAPRPFLCLVQTAKRLA